MPVISARSAKGDGKWKPLPKGTYDITFDNVKERVSSNSNPMIQLEGHVADGQYVGKKANVFYTLSVKSMWRVKMLLEAAGVEYSEVELDEFDEDGQPLTEVQFDSDELVGKTVTYDVIIDQYKGEDQNRFNNERAVGEAAPAAKAAKPAVAARPAAQAAAAPAQAKAAAPAAQPAQAARRAIR